MSRRMWILRVCLRVCALKASRKKLRIPDSPSGIRHFTEMMSVGFLQRLDQVGIEGIPGMRP